MALGYVTPFRSLSPVTVTGVEESVVVPLPSSPSRYPANVISHDTPAGFDVVAVADPNPPGALVTVKVTTFWTPGISVIVVVVGEVNPPPGTGRGTSTPLTDTVRASSKRYERSAVTVADSLLGTLNVEVNTTGPVPYAASELVTFWDFQIHADLGIEAHDPPEQRSSVVRVWHPTLP